MIRWEENVGVKSLSSLEMNWAQLWFSKSDFSLSHAIDGLHPCGYIGNLRVDRSVAQRHRRVTWHVFWITLSRSCRVFG